MALSERFPGEDTLYLRLVARDYAEQWDIPINEKYTVTVAEGQDDGWEWVVVDLPLSWDEADHETFMYDEAGGEY